MDYLNLPPFLEFTLLKKARLEVAYYLNTYFSLNSAFVSQSPHYLELKYQINLSGLAVRFSRPAHFLPRGTTHGCFGAS